MTPDRRLELLSRDVDEFIERARVVRMEIRARRRELIALVKVIEERQTAIDELAWEMGI